MDIKIFALFIKITENWSENYFQVKTHWVPAYYSWLRICLQKAHFLKKKFFKTLLYLGDSVEGRGYAQGQQQDRESRPLHGRAWGQQRPQQEADYAWYNKGRIFNPNIWYSFWRFISPQWISTPLLLYVQEV